MYSDIHLNCAATLLCDLLLTTMHASNCCYFRTLVFHKVVSYIGWRFSAVVASFVARTKLLNVEPG